MGASGAKKNPQTPVKKEVKPIISKPDKVFGSEPIRDIVEPKLKTDLLEPTTKTEVEQTSFSGETSAYLERPYYDEEQLLKAKDIKVDELIKQKKETRERYIKYSKYEEKLEDIAILTSDKINLEQIISEKNSIISSLEANILSLESEVIAAQERVKQIESEFELNAVTIELT